MALIRYSILWLPAALLPLLTTAGQNLEYEYPLILSWLALLILPGVHLFLPDSWKSGEGQNICSLFLRVILIPALLILPGLSLFTANLCPCSLREFVFWYALQAGPALLLAGGLCHMMQLSEQRSGRKITFLLWVLLLLLSIAEVALTLWTNPQKRITHWLAGFIHGPVYDAWIPVDEGILLLRMSQAALGLFLIFLPCSRTSTTISKLPSLFFCVLWLVLNISSARYPGSGNSQKKLTEFFPVKTRKEYFDLYTTDSATKNSGTRHLLKEAEFHTKELVGLLGLSSPPRVGIFVYPDKTKKKLWFGAGDTDVADVYTPTIHITRAGFPHPTLRHELVHALSSGIAWGGLGFHPDMSLTEGLAVALAPEFRSLSLDEGAASLLKSGRISDPETLLSPFFWLESGHRAYTTAGSMVGFFLHRFGAESLRSYYSGADAEKAFGTDKKTLIADWQSHIFSSYDQESSGLYAESLYRSPGLLYSRCPHTKALYRTGSKHWLTLLRLPPEWNFKKDYWHWLRSLQGEEKWMKVAGIRREINGQLSSSEPGEQWIDQTVKNAKLIQNNPPGDIEDLEIGILISDLARLYNREQSIAILADLAAFAETKNPGPGLLRQIHSRLKIEEAFPEEAARRWRLYLAGWKKIPPAKPGQKPAERNWTENYLRLRNPSEHSLFNGPQSLEMLISLKPDPTLPLTFHEQWYFLIGQNALKQEHWSLSKQAFILAAENAPSGKKKRYQEYSRLSGFMSEHEDSNP